MLDEKPRVEMVESCPEEVFIETPKDKERTDAKHKEENKDSRPKIKPDRKKRRKPNTPSSSS
jgi:hypothetical protein